MSLLSVVSELEPFGIYSDDVSLKHYNVIKLFMNDQIKEYQKKYGEMSQRFKSLREMKFETNEPTNQIEYILNNTDEHKTFLNMFKDGYKRDYSKDRTAEVLSDVIEKDSGRLLSDIIITLSLKTLTNPADLLAMFEPAKIEDITALEQIKPKDCVRRYLAKRYANMKELQLDTGRYAIPHYGTVFEGKEGDGTESLYGVPGRRPDSKTQCRIELRTRNGANIGRR
jgi:hypothetical protein